MLLLLRGGSGGGAEGGSGDGRSTKVSRALAADDVMLASRCWKDPGGGTGMERGVRFRSPTPSPPMGCDAPIPSASGEQRAGGSDVSGDVRPYRAISVFS